MSVSAVVTNIARGSLHDGPGVRSVVYLKGCSLRCKWCHNPETLSAKKEIMYAEPKCMHCGKCLSVCSVPSLSNGKIRISRSHCTGCGRCAEACPAGALTLVGEEMDAETLFAELCKDRHYYTASGGGVTFSGGECLLSPHFVADVARKCKETEIHTAVETALFVPWKNVEAVYPYVDLFFADLKIADGEKHRFYTGQDNRIIFQNLEKLSQGSVPVTVRIPVIPTVNDGTQDVADFANILGRLGKAVSRVELLKYNHLAAAKYGMLGQSYISFAEEAQSDAVMRSLADALSDASGKECFFEKTV